MKKVNFLVLLVLVCLLRAQELDYTKAPNSYIFEPTNPNSGLLIPVKKPMICGRKAVIWESS